VIKRALVEAIWKWTVAIMIGVIALGIVVVSLIALSDDPGKPSILVLDAIFLAFLAFSYILYRIMKFIKEKIIESYIDD